MKAVTFYNIFYARPSVKHINNRKHLIITVVKAGPS